MDVMDNARRQGCRNKKLLRMAPLNSWTFLRLNTKEEPEYALNMGIYNQTTFGSVAELLK